MVGLAKNWTEDEKLFLSDNWGSLSIKTICRHLGRSENAINVMKDRLNLGRFLDAGDYVSYSQLLQALYGIDDAGSAYRDSSKFPVRKKRVGKCTFKVVYLNDFWEWAEENKRNIDFSKMAENILGAEPEWVKQKRKIDFECRVNKDPWTKAEDTKLIRMLQKYKYYYTDISAELNRTEGAIKRRCCDLGIKERPLKAQNRVWENGEVQTLVFMFEEGYSFERIGQRLHRSALCCRGKMERINNPGYFNRDARWERERERNEENAAELQ